MKTFITILALFASISAFAGSTDCWTDAQGNIHCSTRDDGDITPQGAY